MSEKIIDLNEHRPFPDRPVQVVCNGCQTEWQSTYGAPNFLCPTCEHTVRPPKEPTP